MVLGNALQEHGTKANMFLCINDDTLEMNMSKLLKAFWAMVPVTHKRLPKHLKKSELKRADGAYSKLQTVEIFSKAPYKQDRFLLLDADTLPRTNIDDLFGTLPPAAVMRGPRDSCLYERRPSATYFQGGTESSYTDEGKKMLGGIENKM